MAIYNLNDAAQNSDATHLVITGATTQNITVNTSSNELLDSNTTTQGVDFVLWNNGTGDCLISFSPTATVGNASFPLKAGWMYKNDNGPYKGDISGICATGSTTIRVSSFEVLEI